MRRLLLAYPRRWRQRYGDELLALLAAEPLTWRIRANVLRSGLGERVRGSGPPPLRVLRAWSFFVVGGMAFQKTSEHWQAVVPAGDRGVPTAAFDAVHAAAVVGTAAVLVAVALALPAFVHDLRDGGRAVLGRPILLASTATAVAAGALVALALHRDRVAAPVFVAFALFSLLGWTHAATTAAQRLELPRVHSYLAHAVTAAMVVMTVAAAAWFAVVNDHAPSFVGAAQLAVTATFMLAGTALAVTAQRSPSRARR